VSPTVVPVKLLHPGTPGAFLESSESGPMTPEPRARIARPLAVGNFHVSLFLMIITEPALWVD
jgi:hypothetical protein